MDLKLVGGKYIVGACYKKCYIRWVYYAVVALGVSIVWTTYDHTARKLSMIPMTNMPFDSLIRHTGSSPIRGVFTPTLTSTAMALMTKEDIFWHTRMV
jgi:hypothetical protein